VFTGNIEQVGKVISMEEKRGQTRIIVQTKFSDLAVGENISLNGVCLTVVEFSPKGEICFLLNEDILSCSNLKNLEAEKKVNLERSLTLQNHISGHVVYGNIDTTGTLLSIVAGASVSPYKLSIALDPKYGRYCAEKAPISVNGVSLTIHSLQETKHKEFLISALVTSSTWQNTSFAELKVGDSVNIEVDILAKYIERLCPNVQQPLSV